MYVCRSVSLFGIMKSTLPALDLYVVDPIITNCRISNDLLHVVLHLNLPPTCRQTSTLHKQTYIPSSLSVSMLKLTRHVAALISFPAGRFCDATPAASRVKSPERVVTAAEQTARLRRRPHHPTTAATVRSNVQLQCTPDFIYAALS